jgi:prepilin-type N-terminal cleavage/methylation domain-containing protein
MSRIRSSDAGFTLVELLVVITLTSVIGATMVTSVVRSLDVTARATSRVEALTDLQRALERMSRNIRVAEPAGNAPVIAAATPTTLRFSVYDPTTRREFTYTHTGDAVTQSVRTFATHTATTATGPVVTPVIGDLDQGAIPVFTYSRADGSAWTTGSTREIARVQLRLLRQTDDDVVEISSGVFLRNTLD